MNAVKEWTFLICLTSIISSLVEFLIPPGKIGKTMNLVLGIFGIIVFFTPFFGTYRNFKNFFENDVFNQISNSKIPPKNNLTENLEKQIVGIGNEKIKLIISRNLKNIGVTPKKIEVFMDKNKQGCIVMIKCKIFLNSSNAGLKEKVKKEIENNLNIKTEVIENTM